MKCILPLCLLAFAYCPGSRASGESRLHSLIQSSSSIVIGRIDTARLDGSLYHVQLHVVASLKGNLTSGAAIAADFTPYGPHKAAAVSPVIPQANLILFLNNDTQGAWRVVPLGVPALGLSGAWFRITDSALAQVNASNSATVADTLVRTMSATLESDVSEINKFMGIVGFNDAPNLFASWSNSSVLRAYGLSARISSGQDTDAIIAASTLNFNQAESMLIASAIRGYRNPDPRGVMAIGKLATSSGNSREQTVSYAYALAAIHTKESVPWLVRLLDSPDHIVREIAVAGLSAFVTNMRIAKDGADAAEARDEVLNPGRQKTIPSANAPFETSSTRQFLHFGTFKDANQESAFIAFWKLWYQQNVGYFPPG